ncbi:glycerol-3-phosphate cytidylyltransferase [Edaphobacillus lindanitolerans]|uniref:Glycerol-3-phosphate cytidylyltransferase n=1 Tax=Edaphobacillus lindanitolerans TaxID=550447 RepID=A0A1U7PI11_9BACI|nr:glycerol-3-phosphate cytidylyltransferase [Edaphobacillus lindanitolerans]SIT70956.1 Glycerol-3-phosphate cytidylyltransferase [Edaphobacillus lindanitolerans]
MKKVLTYGTYDLLHYGHMELLRRAKELGDTLYVGLSTDEFNSSKNKVSYFNFEQRKQMLKGVKYVDFIFEENDWEQKARDIEQYDIDILVMGSDWEGKFDYLSGLCEVIYLPRTEGVSSTKIKEILQADQND